MPIEPNGTSLPLICPLSNLLHITDPTPMPIEKIDKKSVTINSSPFMIFLVQIGNCERKVRPINQNHEIPIIESQTVFSFLAKPMIFQVCEKMLKPIFNNQTKALKKGFQGAYVVFIQNEKKKVSLLRKSNYYLLFVIVRCIVD